jgi:uncharacterized protein YbbK (DUF523 family)
VKKILVSACLLGERVRYNAEHKRPAEATCLDRWVEEGRVVAFCPEVAGGLPVPRPPAEIVSQTPLRVMDRNGSDVTLEFVHGAEQALELVRRYGIGVAVLKSRSPSCGTEWIYDGRFGGALVPGDGVTAALLRLHGVEVFSELELALVAGRTDLLGAGPLLGG